MQGKITGAMLNSSCSKSIVTLNAANPKATPHLTAVRDTNLGNSSIVLPKSVTPLQVLKGNLINRIIGPKASDKIVQNPSWELRKDDNSERLVAFGVQSIKLLQKKSKNKIRITGLESREIIFDLKCATVILREDSIEVYPKDKDKDNSYRCGLEFKRRNSQEIDLFDEKKPASCRNYY